MYVSTYWVKLYPNIGHALQVDVVLSHLLLPNKLQKIRKQLTGMSCCKVHLNKSASNRCPRCGIWFRDCSVHTELTALTIFFCCPII